MKSGTGGRTSHVDERDPFLKPVDPKSSLAHLAPWSHWLLLMLVVIAHAPGCRSRSATPTPHRAPSERHVSPPSPSPAFAAGAFQPAADSEKGPSAPAAEPEPSPSVAVETDWCTDTVTALDRETCYVIPPDSGRELLVYLPGIVPDTPSSPQKTKVMRVVAAASTRAGVAALIPRGLKGLSGKRHRSWWGWPTSEAVYRTYAGTIVSRLDKSRRAFERLAGRRFNRYYLAGSSSGAYFVALLALHGDIRADGFGAMSGGSGHRTPEISGLKPVPFYIGVGKFDSVVSAARGLQRLLENTGWPVQLAVHPFGHGAREVYLKEAFEFWRQAVRERDGGS